MFQDFALDIKIIFSIIGMLISFGVFLNYLRSVLKLRTKPHTYTWLIWFLTQATAVAGLWYGKGGWGALALTISTIFVFIVFLL